MVTKMKTRIIGREEIESFFTMKDAISAVENAFKVKRTAENSEKAWLFYKEQGGDLACWSTYIKEMNISGMKAIGYNTNNYKSDLPTISAVIILHDPKTSFPLAIMDGTSITAIRTGAAGAVAAKYLARKSSKIICIIGAGVQARTQLLGLNELYKIDDVRVYDLDSTASKKFASEMSKKTGIQINICNSAKDAVVGSDIIVTVTPSRKPIVMDDWVKPGSHINAMGADEPGKEEVDPEILKRAKIVVDDRKDTIRRGEINVPISKGIIQAEDIHADLEEIVTGEKMGRESDEELTLFDGAGVAIEDIAVAWAVFKQAENEGVGDSKYFCITH
jgi:alanine dehydrogenase